MAENLFSQRYMQVIEYRETLFGAKNAAAREKCLSERAWWRSLSHTERQAGLCAWMLHSPVVSIVKIPIPWGGVVDVVRITPRGVFSQRLRVTAEVQVLLRRNFFLKPLLTWRVHVESDQVVAVHCPDLGAAR